MNTSSVFHPSRLASRFLPSAVVATLVLATAGSALAENAAIASRVFNGYTRTRLADGSFKPETYAFANGGRWDGAPGDSINDLPFRQLVGTLAVPMTQRGYVSARDPAKTDLLIFVFWGVTKGTSDKPETTGRQNLQYAMQQMTLVQGATGDVQRDMAQRMETFFMMSALEQRIDNRTDVRNAMLLGFQDDLWKAYALDFTQSALDFMQDLKSDRYFVILKAYDFRSAWKEKHRKILWEARFSIMSRGVDFIDSLPAMAYQASRYFGEKTRGVIRRPLPEVNITYGEAKMVSFEPKK